MKKLNRLSNAIFDEHALGVARDQRRATDLEIVGEDNGRVFVAKVDDAHLTQFARIALQTNALVENFGGAIEPAQRRQRDPLPGRGRATEEGTHHLAAAATQGNEVDVALVELVEMALGGQTRIEYQLRRRRSGLLLPESNEAEYFLGLVRLGNAGTGIAQNAPRGVPCQKRQNALLRAAAAGNVVFFQGSLGRVGGDGVKIQVEGSAVFQTGLGPLSRPGGQQSLRKAVVDAGTVGGQVRAFGHGIEAGEQGDAFVIGQAHDLAFAFGAEEFQGQQGAQGGSGGDHDGAWQASFTSKGAEVEGAEQGQEKEETRRACAEGAWGQTQAADVGDGCGQRMNGVGPFVIETAWQAGEAFFLEQQGDGVDADGLAGAGEFALDVVDGEVLFAQGDDEFADAVALGSGPRSGRARGEESGTGGAVVAELRANA